MENYKKGDGDVPMTEPALSVASPQPQAASGLSTSIAIAPAHSPLPWRIRPEYSEKEPIAVVDEFGKAWVSSSLDIVGPNNERTIAEVTFCSRADSPWSGVTNIKEFRANAEHIVMCVNSHDALVDALSCMMDWAREVSDEHLDGDPETRKQYVSDMKAARAALLNAKP